MPAAKTKLKPRAANAAKKTVATGKKSSATAKKPSKVSTRKKSTLPSAKKNYAVIIASAKRGKLITGATKQRATLAKKSAGTATKKTDASKTKGITPFAQKRQTSQLVKKSAATSAANDLDLSGFPPGAVTAITTQVCLACIFDLFTAQLGLAPRTAYTEIKSHAPTIQELLTVTPARPYFRRRSRNPQCPYCSAAKDWQASFRILRIEGSKATDAARRAFVKSLPKRDAQFQTTEIKTTRRALFFEWLDAMGHEMDFENNEWLMEATRRFLERREPKTDWAEAFAGARAVRRSQRFQAGYERDGARLFLAPALYNDALLMQYLLSRSHRHGGETFEGRLTLAELLSRLRHDGHLAAHGIKGGDNSELLEGIIEHLAGGSANEAIKLHFISDRRDFLEKVKTVYAEYAA